MHVLNFKCHYDIIAFGQIIGVWSWFSSVAKEQQKRRKEGDKTKRRWLGPYTVSRALGKGIFQLCNHKDWCSTEDGSESKQAENQCPSDTVTSGKLDPKQPEGDHPSPDQQGTPAVEDPPPNRSKV